MANRQRDKNAAAVRKQIDAHTFSGVDGEEYGASSFGGFDDYFRRKKIKLQNDDTIMRQSVRRPQIFKDVTAHVASYTQPAPEELHRMLVMHGATYIKYLDFKTMATHIIASTLPPKKADDWRRLRVVKPAWVVDSIAAGKLLPWSDYRLMSEGPGQNRLQFGDGGKLLVKDGRPDQMDGYKEQSKHSYYRTAMENVGAVYDQMGATPAGIFDKLDTIQLGMDGNGGIRREDSFEFSDLDVDELESSLLSPPAAQGKDGNSVDHRLKPEDAALQNTAKSDEVNGTEHAKSSYEELPAGQGMPTQHAQHAVESDTPSPGLATSAQAMTSEEHNRLLLEDPKLRKSSTANPDFLKQFYAESRLHHLSTWKAELKAKMQRMAAERDGSRPNPKPTKKDPSRRRYIMHVDFDSFFCAVSLKNAPPEYATLPAAVAHSSGSASEIASCNYPARSFGVKNGMWMRRALELCPDLKVLPYDFPAYEEASRLFYEAILDVGGTVQSVSVDEALVDVTSIVGDADASARVDQIATDLRQRVRTATGCHVSVGVGGNILLAKLALRRAKPAGQYQIVPETVLSILDGLQVEQLPGVAHSIGGKLEEKLGVTRVADLRRVSRDRLMTVLGPKTGTRLYEYARGIDTVEVGADVDGAQSSARKSVSAEVNWGIRFVSQDEAEEFVMNLCRELERRLLHEHVKGRSLTMKILRRAAGAPLDPEKHLGHGKCDVFNKTALFGVATHDASTIGREAVSILRSFHFSPGDLRGLGVQLQKLEPIKAYTGNAALPDSSQKKLPFAPVSAASMVSAVPTKAKVVPVAALKPPPSRMSIFKTPIQPAVPREETPEAPEAAFPSTQFVMPSNFDPNVLAELPPDIIRRLVGEPRHDGRPETPNPSTSSNSRHASPVKRGREPSPAPAAAPALPTSDLNGYDLPPDLPPGIDPEVFAALPADMRAEVLEEYRRSSASSRLRSTASPSTSPKRAQKTKTVPMGTGPGRKGGSPVKKGIWGTRGLAAQKAARERWHDAQNNRVQTSIAVSVMPPNSATASGSNHHHNHHHGAFGTIDPDVLAALPEDMRREVLEDVVRHQAQAQAHAQAHVQAQATVHSAAQPVGLKLQLPPKLPPKKAVSTLPPLPPMRRPPMLHFPPRPPKMGFRTAEGETTTGGAPRILSLEDIKTMLRTWHTATRDEGPHETDVGVLERYLAGVVLQERDMAKARKVVVWLAWIVENAAPRETPRDADMYDAEVERVEDSQDSDGWQYALARVMAAVQAALAERGLDAMVF